ncbi:ATP-binding cassette domain-containing protein [Agarilytica rhodophyticola]|uniref:ATP-binding cassette domain-containing protein n=1 Tax=Agarilytica rhodophyticola TaxID=1737490 RepID=UPI001C1F5266|nr:ATP-binding cassette domain-containing protein [Agarilytica rhodophyticola]
MTAIDNHSSAHVNHRNKNDGKAMSNVGIEVKHTSATINNRVLFEDLSFCVATGEILTIMGPSGTGKSTLLAFLSGTLADDVRAQGKIFLHGQDITEQPPETRKIGVLFQDALLFPHLSVGENLGFGLTSKIRGSERKDRIETALQDAGLAGYSKKDPATLSGGERARVALMRTLLAEPDAILLDEPFSKLDTTLRQQMREFTFAEIIDRNLPCIMVTHDQEDAKAASGKILNLENLSQSN